MYVCMYVCMYMYVWMYATHGLLDLVYEMCSLYLIIDVLWAWTA